MRPAILSLLTGLFLLPLSAADLPPRTCADARPAPTDWLDDPVCRMVFHAVLEGLYEDGVPDAVVDAVVPREKDKADPMKRSFVVQCPLCHPVYEAFAAYQKRPTFAGDPAGRNTFGKGLDEKVVAALSSDRTQTRLQALAPLVKEWVGRRLTALRLTEVEKQEWEKNLAERSGQGKMLLLAHMKDDPSYKGWSWYWGCAACNGTTAACRAVKPVVK